MDCQMHIQDTQRLTQFCKQAFSEGFIYSANKDKKITVTLATGITITIVFLILLLSDDGSSKGSNKFVPVFLSDSKMLDLDYPFGVFSTNDPLFGTQYYEFSDANFNVFTHQNDTRFYLFKSNVNGLSRADIGDQNGVYLKDMQKGHTFTYINPITHKEMYVMIVQATDKEGNRARYMVEKEGRNGYFSPNNSTTTAINYY